MTSAKIVPPHGNVVGSASLVPAWDFCGGHYIQVFTFAGVLPAAIVRLRRLANLLDLYSGVLCCILQHAFLVTLFASL